MKVCEVTNHEGEKLVKFWCPGCGVFHVVPADKWNGNADSPTLSEHTITGLVCRVLVRDGELLYDYNCTHRLAGKTVPIQHEEAWHPPSVPWDKVHEVKPK